jgi:hypothetical protein
MSNLEWSSPGLEELGSDLTSFHIVSGEHVCREVV